MCLLCSSVRGSLLALSQRRRAPWRKIWGRDCKRVGGRAMEQDNQQRAASHNCSLAALGHNPDHFIAADSLAPDVANTRMPSIASHTVRTCHSDMYTTGRSGQHSFEERRTACLTTTHMLLCTKRALIRTDTVCRIRVRRRAMAVLRAKRRLVDVSGRGSCVGPKSPPTE